MKKYKNLSKPELMEKQNTLSVHSGGKFVSLDLETEAQHAGSRKKQAEQILATVVMGMNLVNTVAPLAVLAGAEQKLGAVPQQPARSEAEPLDYAVLPQLADMVDRAIFARAEATEYDGNASVASMGDGDTQTITAGQSGTVDELNGGRRSGGVQTISSGGSGMVSNINGGSQLISSGGFGSANVLNSGYHDIHEGTGILNVMNGGESSVCFGGTGTIITMNNGDQTISSGGTQQVVRGGSGTISTMDGGTQYIYEDGVGTISALNSGGTVYQKSGGIISGITYSGGVQVIDNITAGYDNMTLGSGGTNVTMGVISGAQMSGTILNNGGAQLVLAGGTSLATTVSGGSLQLARGGIVSGLTMTGGSLELSAANGGSFAINGTLSATSASIDMTDHSLTGYRSVTPPAYETLTIDKLSGSGNTFIMDTDLAGETNSDKLIIKDADVGTHYVQIRDLSKLNGIQVTGEHKQLLITDKSGKLTFIGQELSLGGLFDLDPTLAKGDTLGLSAKDWYLTKLGKKISKDTHVLLDAADNSYALWRNTNDSLRSRLGALASGSEHADGIWARTQAGRFSGDNYEGRYNLYQLGYDKSVNAKSIYGLAVDYGDGTGSYDNGSGKDKLKSFSLYSVWTADNGSYTNVTARYGIVATDLDSYGDYPDKAEYKQHACSVSVEYGKRFELERGLFIEPNAQFTLGRLGSIDYTTDRGVNGRIDGMNSALGRIGFVMGQKIENGSDIYLKADLLHEFAGERDLQLTSDAGGTNDILTKHNDYGDTWFELGLGGNVRISKTGNFYGEVTRGFGGDINKKWSVNAGLRFTF